jgi:hypothetical protein
MALLAAMKRVGIGLLFGAGVCLGQGANPDHLEPISPYDPIGYGQTVFNALIGKRPAELWMMCMPTVHPEWAVILRSESEHSKSEASPDSKEDALSNPDEKRKWVLEIAVAAQQVSDLRKNGKVERKRMELDEAAAKALQEAWTAVTGQTRYARGNTGGFDGVTYQFYSSGQFGETWSPATGLPAVLVELGARLLKCVASPAEKRGALLEEALGMAKDIKNRADSTGGKSGEGSGSPAR